MKVVITLAVLCWIASVFALVKPIELSAEQRAKAFEYLQECIKQENVSEAEAARIGRKDYANPSKNIKCFGTCFFEKVGSLKNGVVQEDVVLAKLGSIIGEENTKAILAKCRDIKGEDRCDTGFKLFECFESANAELMAA